MRLDKYLSNNNFVSRTDCKKAAKAGLIKVNGIVVKDTSVKVNEEADIIEYNGVVVNYNKFTYLMLNKPVGYISSTDDPKKKTVLELFPENYRSMGLFPCGRLDIDTTGLLILTNDGQLAHRLLSPKHHVYKTYYFECSPNLTDKMVRQLETGVDIGEKEITKPAILCPDEKMSSGTIAITEGKFHQIKRMFEQVGSKITRLKRIKFAEIDLDDSLKDGEWRHLTDEEVEILTSLSPNN